jgi:hypothetical protein
MFMFKPLQPDFDLKRLVTFIAALWLQVTVLVILCCISSPQMSSPSNNVDTLHTTAGNGACTVAAHAVATAMAASPV